MVRGLDWLLVKVVVVEEEVEEERLVKLWSRSESELLLLLLLACAIVGDVAMVDLGGGEFLKRCCGFYRGKISGFFFCKINVSI